MPIQAIREPAIYTISKFRLAFIRSISAKSAACLEVLDIRISLETLATAGAVAKLCTALAWVVDLADTGSLIRAQLLHDSSAARRNIGVQTRFGASRHPRRLSGGPRSSFSAAGLFADSKSLTPRMDRTSPFWRLGRD